MHLYHPRYASWFQTCTYRGLCIWSSQVKAYVICKAWGPLVYYQETFVILIMTLTFLKTKLTSAQGRSPSCIQQGLHSHRYQGVLEGDMLYAAMSGWSARRLTTWIIHTSIGRSIPSYICMSEEAIYYKPVALPIQWEGWLRRLISKSWFERLIQKSKSWFGRLGK